MTTTRTLISTLIVAAVVVGLCSVVAAASVRGGYSRPIDNVNDPHIQELGRWAVSEHVKQASDGLVFNKVVSGTQQVVAGMNYVLVLDATDTGGKVAAYRAFVYEQLWTNTRKLRSFTSAN